MRSVDFSNRKFDSLYVFFNEFYQISALKKELESVRQHRKLYRNRRHSVPMPVVSLVKLCYKYYFLEMLIFTFILGNHSLISQVGYTNAGKSTLLNRLTGAGVLAEDKLFATLDPTTRRVQVKYLSFPSVHLV
jgi:GTPase